MALSAVAACNVSCAASCRKAWRRRAADAAAASTGLADGDYNTDFGMLRTGSCWPSQPLVRGLDRWVKVTGHRRQGMI